MKTITICFFSSPKATDFREKILKKSGEDLKYKQIKWLILTIPTITIALSGICSS